MVPAQRFVFALICALAGAMAAIAPAMAGTLSIRDVVERLAHARPGAPADLSGLDLSNLDLSGMNFKGAVLRSANLFGADLTDADLSHTDLTGARLDRATIIRTNFSGARMVGVSLILPSAFTTLSPIPDEAPSFAGADMSRAVVNAKLAGCDMTGTNLTGALFDNPRERVVANAHSDLSGCRMMRANLTGARMATMRMALVNLSGAILTGADLSGTDLSGANLAGATLGGADLSEARLFNTMLIGATGLDQARGVR